MSDIQYIKTMLESAGRTEMMLSSAGTRPKGYTSGWPEILREFSDMIEAPKQNTPVRLRPTMQQMNEYEEVQGWIVGLGVYCQKKRMTWVAKATALASLHSPVTGRRVLSFAKIARRMDHVSHQTVRNWYEQGQSIILNQGFADKALKTSQTVIDIREHV